MYSWAMPTAACTLFMCMAITNGEPHDATSLPNEVPKAKPEAGVCLTPQCIYAATRILTRMNFKVRPCDDFYEFVCGDYAQSAAIPDGSPMINQSYEKELETISRMQRLIEDIDESKAPAAFSDLKKMYNKCIADELSTRDESTDNSDDEWNENVIRIKNQWYMLARDNWIGPEYDASAVGGLIFRFDPKPSVRNHSIEVLELAIDDTAIPWRFLRGRSFDIARAYFRYLRDVAIYLSGDESGETRVAEDLPEILSFEMVLAEVLFPEEDIHKSSFKYHVTTVGDLDRKYPSWQLKQRIVEVHDVDVVQIPFDLQILDNLERVIAKTQGSRNFDAWVIWRLTDLQSDRLGRFVAHEKKLLHDSMSGNRATTSLKEKCVERVRSKLPFLLNVLYYGQYLSDSAVKRSKQILDNVRQQYVKYINEAVWLDFKIKDNAAKKIKTMKNNIGIFEKFMLDKNSNASPGEAKLSDGFLADNRANLTKILLHTNPSREERYNFIKSHARYNYESQRINIGGVPYTDAYYDVDRPEALNYGAFGYVVGIEVAYSFDEKGRHFDKNGEFESWGNSKNDAILGRRSKCLVKQYNDYAFNEFGLLLDYVKPRNEDIANNVGAKAAYFAYDQWSKDKAPEKRLPGLNYSPKQLFWISLAATQCTRYRPEFVKHGSLADKHTLAKIRVNITLSNLPEFSNDFQCNTVTNMIPLEKCALW